MSIGVILSILVTIPIGGQVMKMMKREVYVIRGPGTNLLLVHRPLSLTDLVDCLSVITLLLYWLDLSVRNYF